MVLLHAFHSLTPEILVLLHVFDSLAPEILVSAVVAGVAVVTDMRNRRIPNILTFGTMALALVMYALRGEPLVALSGIAVAFALSFPAFLAGGAMRAGDAKLLMALGALLGAFMSG